MAIANGEVERAPTMTMMRDVAIAKKKGTNGERFKAGRKRGQRQKCERL